MDRNRNFLLLKKNVWKTTTDCLIEVEKKRVSEPVLLNMIQWREKKSTLLLMYAWERRVFGWRHGNGCDRYWLTWERNANGSGKPKLTHLNSHNFIKAQKRKHFDQSANTL